MTELDQLKAQCNLMRKALELMINADKAIYECEDCGSGLEIGKLADIQFKNYKKSKKLLSLTPTQCLAEHDQQVISEFRKEMSRTSRMNYQTYKIPKRIEYDI
jgi:hypothetical protein